MSDQHETHHVNYLYVFFALCFFTSLSVLMDLIHIESKAVLIVIVLSISVCKALCVMMFFMHLKYEGNWKYIILLPTSILAIGLPLAMLPDIGLHYYFVDVPQNETVLSHSKHADGSGHAIKVDHADTPAHSKPADKKTESKKKH